MRSIIGIATNGEAKVWCDDRIFSLIQKGEELNYNGRYAFELVRYIKDRRGNDIRILRPLFCVDDLKLYLPYFETLVYNKSIMVDSKFYRFVNAIMTGKIVLENVSKQVAEKLYEKMCTITSVTPEEQVKQIYASETTKAIVKEMYNILISCNREKTNLLLDILQKRQETSGLDFEILGRFQAPLLVNIAGKATIWVIFTNGETEKMKLVKAVGTYKDKCLNYRVVKKNGSSYISFEEIYPCKSREIVVAF